jgi:hypothetical protein
LLIILCITTGISFAYIYNRLPAMQIRYKTYLREEERVQKKAESGDKRIEGQDSLDNFLYESFYQPIRDAVDTWKGHVKDSLKVEQSRIAREKNKR